MSEQQQWFQDLLSKVEPEHFDTAGAPDLIEAWVENDGERLAHWVRTAGNWVRTVGNLRMRINPTVSLRSYFKFYTNRHFLKQITFFSLTDINKPLCS